MKKSIFVFLTFFIFIMGIFNPVHVDAYTADTPLTGYPFIVDPMYSDIYTELNGSVSTYSFSGTIQERNSYLFDIDRSISNISNIRFGNMHSSNIIPIDIDLYDYYIIGTIAFTSGNISNLSHGSFVSYDGTNYFYSTANFNCVDFDNLEGVDGKSFYGKINSINNSNFSYLHLYFNDNTSIINGDIWLSVSIVPVSKGSDDTAILNSILQKLTEINNNLVQHDTNVGSWISDFKNSVGSLMATLIQKVDAGFTALYNQMTKEQDEKLNGYDGSVASGANTEFQSGAEDLTQIEGQLNTNSTTYVNEFTSTGFNTGILTTLGSSLTFVVTWFTNFWNMGGIWTVGLSTCFAIWIAFYILRTRSK